MSTEVDAVRYQIITEAVQTQAHRIHEGQTGDVATLMYSELQDTKPEDLELMVAAKLSTSRFASYRKAEPVQSIRLPQSGIQVSAADVAAAAAASGVDPNSQQARADAQLIASAKQYTAARSGFGLGGFPGNRGA